MDFLELLKKAKEQAAANQQDDYSALKSAPEQFMDRLKMNSHPDLQGPRLPESTPEEQRVTGLSMNTAMGTLGPSKVEGARAVADAALASAEGGAKAGARELPFAQQALSREADFAQRLKDQQQASKFAKIKAAMGR